MLQTLSFVALFAFGWLPLVLLLASCYCTRTAARQSTLLARAGRKIHAELFSAAGSFVLGNLSLMAALDGDVSHAFLALVLCTVSVLGLLYAFPHYTRWRALLARRRAGQRTRSWFDPWGWCLYLRRWRL